MRKDNLAKYFAYLVFFAVILNFYYIHLKNSLNFPYHDEFRTISKVILDFNKADSVRKKLTVLLVNENESLQLFLKLSNILFFYIFGKIRYDLLSIIGQISLIVYPTIVYLLNKKKENLIFHLGFTILIIFNLQYYVLSFRHDTAFYYFVGVFGTLISIFYWVKRKYTLSVLFFLIGIFNNSSSILVLFVFIFDFVISNKKANVKILASIVIIITAVLGLFYSINPTIFYVNQKPLIIFSKFLIIMGNYFEFIGFNSELSYILIGSIFLIIFVSIIGYYFYKSIKKNAETKFYALSASYFLITIFVIGIKRSMLNLDDLLDARYKFFTFSLLLFIILLYIELFSIGKKTKYFILILLLIYNVYYSFKSKDYIRYLYQGGKINSVALANNYDVLGPTYINFSIKYYKEMASFNISPEKDAYFISIRNYIKSLDLNTAQISNTSILQEKKLSFEQKRNFTVCKLNGFTPNKESYIFLKSSKDIYIFPITFYLRNSKSNFLKTFSFTGQYFYCFIYISLLEKGLYNVGIISKNKETSTFNIELSNQKLKI